MPCDHKGGPELIEMAEEFLRNGGRGTRFRWSENLDGAMWASVVVEVERRDNAWVVTRLDRLKEPVGETGFRAL